MDLKVVESFKRPGQLSLRTVDAEGNPSEGFNRKLLREAGFKEGDDVTLTKKMSLMDDAVDKFNSDCAKTELLVIDNLLLRVLNEANLKTDLAGLIMRVLHSHKTGTMMSSEDRGLCR